MEDLFIHIKLTKSVMKYVSNKLWNNCKFTWISLLSDYVDLNLPLDKVSQRKEEIFKEQTEILSSPIKTTSKGYKILIQNIKALQKN